MSGYRSLKRVLGETNLERKVRWLFGICVGGLILLAFWWVDWIAEDLIKHTAQNKGRDLVRTMLFDLHWQHWTLAEEKMDAKLKQEAVAAMTRELAQEDFEAQLLTIAASPPKNSEVVLPISLVKEGESDHERAILLDLKARAEEQLRSPPEPGELPADAAGSSAIAPIAPRPVFEAFSSPDQGRYYYYQVINWTNECAGCHEGMHGSSAESAAFYDGSIFDPISRPFRVVRVSMPYQETRAAIDRTRAVLITVGIVTMSLSMLALWLVVRYVVVKPLTHLRDVSDAVSTGDLAQRADIHTGDEFEDLATSFNKMLRHLIEAQAELQTANLNLDGKVDELARLNMQLHEMNRLKGEYLATMSHELRTPLNSIIGFSEVLGNIESLTDKQRRYVQNIQKGGKDLLEMINDILDLEKMEAGKMDVRPSEFRIENILSAQCDLVRQLAEDKNIDLDMEVEKDLPFLFQDQAKVQQILMNLLSNAIKFTPEGGRIRVGAKGDSRGRIEFWVADTGVGIPESEREVIFEKFRQGKAVLGRDNLTREYSGTGLGLSIVKELCKLLGGEITVESELGKGSTFRVIIPWMRADSPAAAMKLNTKLDELSRPRRADTSENGSGAVLAGERDASSSR
jgi:two-component system sensor histidine kinase BarA